MKIVLISSYGPPWLSGLTKYVEGVARHLADAGHEVTWVCSDEAGRLKTSEQDPIRYQYIKPLFKFGRGVFIGHGLATFRNLLRESDIVMPVLPFPEAGLLRFLTDPRKLRPFYVCRPNVDSPSALGQLLLSAVNLSHWMLLKASRAIAVLSLDYGYNIPQLKSFQHLLRPLPPLMPDVLTTENRPLLAEAKQDRPQVIGFVGRPTFEKGIPILVQAFQDLLRTHPQAELHFVGPPAASDDLDALGPALETLDASARQAVKIRGKLNAADLEAFYEEISLLALPSTDSLEAFGMVQVEAMMRGAPVVASSLPGVRLPIQKTGMGILCDPGNVGQVAQAFRDALDNRSAYVKKPEVIREALLPILSPDLIDRFVSP